MASTKHIPVRRERSHRHIFSSEIPAYQHRETNSLACRPYVLGTEHCLPC